MNKEIKVSIICNVYNHGPYVRDAMEGFVSQKTDFPFEVLVHDDASTDDSAAIIREYEEKYPEIIKPIYQTENQYSKKVPIHKTFQNPRVKGKYIALCEGDDYWTDPLKLQKQVDFLDAHPDYSLCACGSVWHNLKTGAKQAHKAVYEDTDLSLEEIILAFNGTYFQYASIMLKSEIFMNRANWMRLFPIGDYPLTVHAALQGKIRLLADVMTVYRYYASGSWTVRMDNDVARARICERMIEGLNALDEATQNAHHDIIQKRILHHKYTLALMNHDYQALKSGELKAMFAKRSLPQRLSDWSRCKYPKLYAALGKPLARLVKSRTWKTNKTKQ